MAFGLKLLEKNIIIVNDFDACFIFNKSYLDHDFKISFVSNGSTEVVIH